MKFGKANKELLYLKEKRKCSEIHIWRALLLYRYNTLH